jgi:protein-disulfide isomerase
VIKNSPSTSASSTLRTHHPAFRGTLPQWLFLSCAIVFTTAQCKPEPFEEGAKQQQQQQPQQGEAPAASTGPAPPAQPKLSKDDIGASAVRVPIDGLPTFGNASALVTIVAFTDYECPYCARADDRIATLRAEYGDRIRMVVVSHPLPIHEKAAPAARAFLAAAEQGPAKAEAMHLRLFAAQKETALEEEGLRAAARDAGLDLAAFDRARKSSSIDAALRKAETLGNALSVEGTPTFFVNGRRLVGARPIDAFRALIDEELIKAQAIVDKGVAPDKVYAQIVASSPEAPPPKSQQIEGADEIVDVGIEGAPLRGTARAPVTIVFFSDFECPFCVKAETTLRSVEAANPSKVRVAFRHRPLPMHAHARLASKASIAAEKQNRFWEYHDVLLAHRDALSREDLERYASQVGLNVARFNRDLDDPALDARIAADEKLADSLGVKGTPTAFVNGRRITGAQPLATWLGAVDRAMGLKH